MSQPNPLPMPATAQPIASAGHPVGNQPAHHQQRSPAGWYPDPAGAPLQRYYDGQQWTAHTAPAVPPQPQAAPSQASVAQAVAVTVNTASGPNHALHALLTVVTCGLWLPVWIVVAIFGRR